MGFKKFFSQTLSESEKKKKGKQRVKAGDALVGGVVLRFYLGIFKWRSYLVVGV